MTRIASDNSPWTGIADRRRPLAGCGRPTPKAVRDERGQRTAGFSMIELLIVVALIAILGALVVPSVQPSLHNQLIGAGQTLAGDLSFARNLAVANGSRYRVSFDVVGNRYTLDHTGVNSVLNTLPTSAFATSADTATQRITDLSGTPIQIVAVGTMGSTPQPATTLEFDSLGATTSLEETSIWLAVGSAAERRYVEVRVNPVTGLVWTEEMTTTGPTGAIQVVTPG